MSDSENRTAGEALEVARADFYRVADLLNQLAEAAIDQGATAYPVFIATQLGIGLGLPMLDRDAYGLTNNFRISPLEELIRKKVILEEHRRSFEKTYGDPRRKAALLVVHDEGAEIAFLPYSSQGEETDPAI